MSYPVLIVEDEPPARAKLRRFLAELTDFQVVAEADSVASGVAAIAAHRPALIYLDIQLGHESGFAVLERLTSDSPALVVFTTAYSKYAVQAFELHALDYLLKPFDRDRFRKSIERTRAALRQSDAADLEERIRRLLSEQPGRAPPLERLLIREPDRSFFIPVDAILCIAAAGNYLDVHTAARTFVVRETLTALAAQLDPQRFLRVHRSHLVRLDFIAELRPASHGDYQLILRDGTELSLSRRFKALLPTNIREKL